jgi:hypothetical protein
MSEGVLFSSGCWETRMSATHVAGAQFQIGTPATRAAKLALIACNCVRHTRTRSRAMLLLNTHDQGVTGARAHGAHE